MMDFTNEEKKLIRSALRLEADLRTPYNGGPEWMRVDEALARKLNALADRIR